MSETIQSLMTRNLLDVFGGRDPAPRRAAVDALYAEGAVFGDHGRIHSGRDGIDAAAAAVQAATPGFVFAAAGEVQTVGNAQDGAGRLNWTYGPAEDPHRVTGTDFALVRDGKIRELYVFLDG
ncbi:hypothetical protein GCM10007301_00790 [Azorhizobium oxalatiphilum]|uniref:SnoaL-like domain-containing protein n=1 Tax=Azorhizobium oxalatiphilum TaxID=980631 RepID=A0A917F5E1_9HYPH|nr:nuclear transport factor 2 family protein [Azorhizobium oxalatiphilum]GGF45129.1 hypothetical protein GCM10007301_00790 [Azorhizobium oxalatiphilum]